MKAFFLHLTADGLLIVHVAAVFACVAGVTFWLLRVGQQFLARYRDTFTQSASANMADMFLFIDPTRLFYLNLAAIVILPAIIWVLTRDTLSTVAVLLLLVIMPRFVYTRMRKKRLARFEQQLPDALMMLSGSLRAGASLNMAIESLVRDQPAPLNQEFELFLRAQRIGLDFETGLSDMEARLPIQDFSMFVAALRINREIGGNLAAIMESLADTLRRKAMMEGKIESLTAQGKLQGIVMTGLPVLLAVLLNFLEPQAMSKLWTTPIGWGVLTVIVVMEALGYFMIRKITTIDV